MPEMIFLNAKITINRYNIPSYESYHYRLCFIYINLPRMFMNIAQTTVESSSFFPDPFCYKTLSNHFYKSITIRKGITSVNSTIKMYQF